MKDSTYQLICEIHAETLDRFTYLGDQENFGLVEHWPDPRMLPDYPEPFTGDCDDFALMCRKELNREGIPNRLMYVITETGGGHLVTEVEGYILDNRSYEVMRRDDLPYTFISMSGYTRGDRWHLVSE